MKAPARFPVVPLLIAGLFSAMEVRADGGFVAAMDPIEEPTQTALILHADGIQEMTLEVSYEGPARDFGWLVPLPAVPEVETADEGLFSELARSARALPFSAAPRGRDHGRGAEELLAVGVRMGPEIPTPVLSSRVYPASEREELFRWMEDHRLTRTPAVDAAVNDYLARGWVFVAMNIAADDPAAGDRPVVVRRNIRPVRFRFPAEEPVFPLRISAVNPGPSDVLVYVLSDRFMAPRTSRHLSWNTRLGDARRAVRQATAFRPEQLQEFRTTRLFARVRPEEMTQDVYFGAYDPAPGLLSQDVEERIEAMTIGGYDGRRELGARILARVSELTASAEDPRNERELRAGLWALGRLRVEEGVSLLLHHAGLHESPHRETALRALGRLDSREVEPFLIDQLVGGRTLLARRQSPHHVPTEAWERLMRHVAPENIPRLREAVIRSRAHDEWRGLSGRQFHPDDLDAFRLLALSARHGDLLARQTIVDALVASGPEEPWVNNGMSLSRRLSRRSPSDWADRVDFDDRVPNLPPEVRRWSLVVHTGVLFLGHPRDALDLFSEAAADHRMPPAARDRLVRYIEALEDSIRSARLMAGGLHAPRSLPATTPGAVPSAPAGVNGSS